MSYRHGLRVSELIALRWDQIDLKLGTIHVNRLKNGSDAVHPLRGPQIRALRRLRREYPSSPYVFSTERQGPLTASTVRHIVRRAGESYRPPNVRFAPSVSGRSAFQRKGRISANYRRLSVPHGPCRPGPMPRSMRWARLLHDHGGLWRAQHRRLVRPVGQAATRRKLWEQRNAMHYSSDVTWHS